MKSLNKTKQTWIKKGALFITTVLYVWFTAIPVAVADDTAIFFAGGDDVPIEARPNVLLLLDTSKEMLNYDPLPVEIVEEVAVPLLSPEEIAENDADGDGFYDLHRLDRMRRAMQVAIPLMSGLNVGLARYTNPGGAIMFPVEYVDDPWINPFPGGSSAVNTTASLGGNNSDGVSDYSAYVADLDDEEITMGIVPALPDTPIYETVIIPINTSVDDVEQDIATGNISATDTVLNGWTNTDDSLIGLRFDTDSVALSVEGNDVPDMDSTLLIRSAVIKLNITSADNQSPDGEITANVHEDNGSINVASALTDPGLWQDSAITTTWSFNKNVGLGVHTSPNISAMLGEVFNGSGWTAGDSISFKVARAPVVQGNNNGERTFDSFDKVGGTAPVLEITYCSNCNSAEDTVHHTGLVFVDVDIPQGATITRANIAFTASASQSGTQNPITFTVQAFDEANTAQDFDGTLSDLLERPLTTASSDWTIAETWEPDLVYASDNFAAQVQELVDRTDWCGGNNLGFRLLADTEGTDYRGFYAADHATGAAPRLNIEFTGGNGGCYTVEENVQIASAPADASEQQGAAATILGNDTLHIDKDTGDNIWDTGLLFEGVGLSQNAVITDAWLEFVAADAGSTPFAVTIAAEKTANATVFTADDGSVDARTPTTATVNWASSDTWEVDQSYRSPSITAVIQEIVNQGGWTNSNNIAVLLEGSGTGRRSFHSYDASPFLAARLVVKAQTLYTGGDITNKTRMTQIMEELVPKQGRPVNDTILESAYYWGGDEVSFGATRVGVMTRISHPRAVVDVNGASPPVIIGSPEEDGGSTGVWNLPRAYDDGGCSYTNYGTNACTNEKYSNSYLPTYISPIAYECQTNHNVVLTSGDPATNAAASSVATLIGSDVDQEGNTFPSCAGSDVDCGHVVTNYLNQVDQSSLPGDQVIQTHVVGFAFDGDGENLSKLSTAGGSGGLVYYADTVADLVKALKDIAEDILEKDSTFVAPAATVNSFNRLHHLDQLYFAVFRPASGPKWHGNVKRYRLNGVDALIEDASEPPQPAVDDTGFFSEHAQSFWSTLVDGAQVDLGGVAEQIVDDPALRKVYTYIEGNEEFSTAIYSDSNKLTYANYSNPGLLTLEHFGLSLADDFGGSQTIADEYMDGLIKWARGEDFFNVDDNDPDTIMRRSFGDPLHSRPAMVTYGLRDGVTTPADGDDFDIRLFFGTNEGGIHAVDAIDGTEEWVFYPEEMLPLQNNFMDESNDHLYGMDGDIVAWAKDVNFDGTITSSEGDGAYLFVGMRRGGANYYAMDITDVERPEIMWIIRGGPGGTPGFESMMQSWSKPIKTKIKIKTSSDPDVFEVVDVLIFAGGYDVGNDSTPSTMLGDNYGNSLFIVEALTGELLYRAGNDLNVTAVPGAVSAITGTSGFHLELDDMRFAMPAAPKVIDLNSDGLADQIYIGDMGGQIWRFDIRNGRDLDSSWNYDVDNLALSTEPFMWGGVIASFADPLTPADHRRFFATPDLSFIEHPDGTRRLSLNIGSGWRANPLNTDIQDRFYHLEMPPGFTPPDEDGDLIPDYVSGEVEFLPLTEANLYDATVNTLGQGTDAEVDAAQLLLNSSVGWYISLDQNEGEKVLAASLTLNNQVIFTTYTPSEDHSSGCNTALGTGRVYIVNNYNATPAPQNNEEDLVREDRVTLLDSTSLPPPPQMFIPEEGGPITLVGAEGVEGINYGVGTYTTYWYEKRQ